MTSGLSLTSLIPPSAGISGKVTPHPTDPPRPMDWTNTSKTQKPPELTEGSCPIYHLRKKTRLSSKGQVSQRNSGGTFNALSPWGKRPPTFLSAFFASPACSLEGRWGKSLVKRETKRNLPRGGGRKLSQMLNPLPPQGKSDQGSV